jgi:hypothetical protein
MLNSQNLKFWDIYEFVNSKDFEIYIKKFENNFAESIFKMNICKLLIGQIPIIDSNYIFYNNLNNQLILFIRKQKLLKLKNKCYLINQQLM